MSLFDKLKSGQKTEVKKASGKKEAMVLVKNKNNKDSTGDDLYDNIKAFRDKKADLDVLEAEIASLDVEIRGEAMNAFDSDCKASGYKGTIVIQAEKENGDTARIQFLPTDKYLSIKEGARADELKDMYGDIVEETDTVTVNTELFKKYEKEFMKVVAKANPNDADKIFNLKTTFSVKKGTVDNIVALAAKRKESIVDAMKNLGVVTQLKAPKVTEEATIAAQTGRKNSAFAKAK